MEQSVLTTVKQYLSDSKCRISLEELMMQKTRACISDCASLNSNESIEFGRAIKTFEDATGEFTRIVALIAHYGEKHHASLFSNTIKRLSEIGEGQFGSGVLQVFPIYYLSYVAGISPLLSDNFLQLSNLLNCTVNFGRRKIPGQNVIRLGDIALQYVRTPIFQSISGYNGHYVAESDYLFETLQPIIDELFFPGTQYQYLFDRFECIKSMVYADAHNREQGGAGWDPIGRFGYLLGEGPNSPLQLLKDDVDVMKNNWP